MKNQTISTRNSKITEYCFKGLVKTLYMKKKRKQIFITNDAKSDYVVNKVFYFHILPNSSYHSILNQRTRCSKFMGKRVLLIAFYALH